MVTAGLAFDAICGSSRWIPLTTPKVIPLCQNMAQYPGQSRDLPRLEKIQVHTPATPKVADPTWMPRKLKYEWFGSVSSCPDFLGDVPTLSLACPDFDFHVTPKNTINSPCEIKSRFFSLVPIFSYQGSQIVHSLHAIHSCHPLIHAILISTYQMNLQIKWYKR